MALLSDKHPIILGISAYYHDSAAAISENGEISVAIAEERLTRRKHDNRFPKHAIDYCLEQRNLSIGDIDYVAYYEKPLLKFERILEAVVDNYPRSFRFFADSVREWFGTKIHIEREIRSHTGYQGSVYYVPHHYSHAAAAFFTSPFEHAAVITIDGVGEQQTAVMFEGTGAKLREIKSIKYPHSLGLLYSTFTSFLGFQVNEGEYKVMGLAALGEARYKDLIYSTLSVHSDGSFELLPEYFSFVRPNQMWSPSFEKLFGRPRAPSEPLSQRHRDIAASVQAVLEDLYMKVLAETHATTGLSQLCMGGGVALNSLANGKIHLNTEFQDVYIFGASGDDGGAAGAALFAHHHILGNQNRKMATHLQLGTSYSQAHIEQLLTKEGLPYEQIDNIRTLSARCAALLSAGCILGWFQGGSEFGYRALGGRSILASPADSLMKDRLNRLKQRESFRPFGVSVLQEHVHEYFALPPGKTSFPFMNFCFPARKRSLIPAGVHKDGTTRIHTVGTENQLYRQLLGDFYDCAGIPCLLNTSLNTRGMPLCERPEDAVELFRESQDMDYLVIENFLVARPGTRKE